MLVVKRLPKINKGKLRTSQRWYFKHPPPIFIRGLHSLKRAQINIKLLKTIINLFKLFFINKWRSYVNILFDIERRSLIGNSQVIAPPSLKNKYGYNILQR